MPWFQSSFWNCSIRRSNGVPNGPKTDDPAGAETQARIPIRKTDFGPPSLPEENDGLWQTGVKSDVSRCLSENRPMSWGPWSPTALTSGVLAGWCSARWPPRRKTQRCICCRRGYDF